MCWNVRTMLSVVTYAIVALNGYRSPRPARHVETFPSFNRINTAINLCVADKQRYNSFLAIQVRAHELMKT
jgi:hypothetical protein